MAGKIRFELDKKGVRELLHSSELKSALEEEARKRKPSMDGYEVESFNAGMRVVAKIQAGTYEARKDNLSNNTLLKALGRH